MMRRLDEERLFSVIPPVAVAEKLSFEERIELGFKMALNEGMNTTGAVPAVMAAIGDRFGKGNPAKRFAAALKQPQQLPRILKGVLKSKLAGRPLLPRDIWNLKGMVVGGTDCSMFRDKLKYQWGCYPFDIYVTTEGLIMATQAWNFKDMTFMPQIGFYEFMEVPEYERWKQDHSYRPPTLLYNEVKANTRYVFVMSNFKGGIYTRYIIGDVLEITALRDEETGVNLPQMSFYSRADGNIEFTGWSHAYFTEKVIWKGIMQAGVPCVGWVARKELENMSPVIRIYVEVSETAQATADMVMVLLHEQFKKLMPEYQELEIFLGFKPVRVSILPVGSFDKYMAHQRAAGADFAHIKPPSMNPSDSVMSLLLGREYKAGATGVEPREVKQT
ncbi:GH3 auxin-responsive promoter family protein [Chloroflexota bacterium]